MFYFYEFVLLIFIIFSPILFLIRIISGKEDPKRFLEKFCLYSNGQNKNKTIWFHGASIGEIVSIIPLVKVLEKNKKINKILLTSSTTSSASVIKKYKFKKTIHVFFPIDTNYLTNRFIRYWKPQVALFIDSEIWPNMFNNLNKNKIPIILLNGRITKKSFLRWKKFPNFSKKIFNKFDLCISSNKESEFFLKDLGAKNIKNFGNLKFTNSKNINQNKLKPDFLLRLANRKVWCAASTHSGEEIFCANIHQILKKMCDRHNKNYYHKYKKWCDEYFYLMHRKEPRGIGGIFFDYKKKNFEKDFKFVRDVGITFQFIFNKIINNKLKKKWTKKDKEMQYIKRGRYAEFNLLYDRGTKFGLQTGGNVEGILMSLPPVAMWK